MTVQLNHTIVWCRDQQAASSFLAEILGRPKPTRFGPFMVVELDNGVSLDFYQQDEGLGGQHYAFLIGEDEFDAAFERIRKRGMQYWDDPARTRPNEINRHDGGRGVYFKDLDDNLLEIITRPYGSGG
jgi:catechol 2,3-dioxygenase-like lactoylglutathione lyase family enzyme